MKATFATFLILAAIGVGAWAQDGAIAGEKAVRVGVLDMDRLLHDSNIGKDYTARIEKLQKELQAQMAQKQAELERMDERIRTMQAKLDQDRATLSADAFEEKRHDLAKASREREAFFQDGQAELQRRQRQVEQQNQDLNQDLNGKIAPVVREAVQAKNLDIVIDKRVCVSVSNAFDVTEDVLARVNQTHAAAAPASK
ncbi:MAG: OmpH family outer membrane protein [Vicinamibacteria bacterium]|nr:OmpH family outer membrane protein [Vicinamibacteria bacterium]